MDKLVSYTNNSGSCLQDTTLKLGCTASQAVNGDKNIRANLGQNRRSEDRTKPLHRDTGLLWASGFQKMSLTDSSEGVIITDVLEEKSQV